MKPGPEQVVACPTCGMLERRRTLISGNTLGARVWSDGKVVAPMLPKNPDVVLCHGCGECYWLADARAVGTIDLWPAEEAPERSPLLEKARELGLSPPSGHARQAVDPEWTAAPWVREPSEAEYYDALARGLAVTSDQERSLRILAWWRSNDPERGVVPHRSGGSAPANRREENLRALAALIDASNAESLLLKAEVLRELGEFDAALEILERGPAEPTTRFGQLRALCLARDARVRQLQSDEGSASD